jgi:molybdopterin-guanine dinucleotide biosynthesis protein A
MCGGKSLRMGTDKGLIPIGDTCWANFMADKLTALGLPVTVSINTSQLDSYSTVFNAGQLVADALHIGGPLNGLLSVQLQYPDDDLLLLGCDMIYMETVTITRLIDTYTSEAGFDFYTYQNQEFAEPLCAIYTAQALRSLSTHTDTLSGLSFQKVLNDGHSSRLPITEVGSFQNNNTLL